jgi:D-glycero-D-manno-heptose 1,7-bisphosphate phosphatase
MARRAAVFLDRDGVLNEAFLRDGVPVPPPTVREFRLLPGVVEACREFAAAGLALVVVTNQPDLSRGTLTTSELEQIHEELRRRLPVDAIYVCPHDGPEGCACRKPRPGMMLRAAEDLQLDLTRSVCGGDRWRDIDSARRAGVHSVHIAWNDQELLHEPADAVCASLHDAREEILAYVGSR